MHVIARNFSQYSLYQMHKIGEKLKNQNLSFFLINSILTTNLQCNESRFVYRDFHHQLKDSDGDIMTLMPKNNLNVLLDTQ